MSQLPDIDYPPLDPDALEHQKLLQRSHHCARPVLYAGKRHFIHTMTEYESGGSIGMDVHLKGIVGPIDYRQITVEKEL